MISQFETVSEEGKQCKMEHISERLDNDNSKNARQMWLKKSKVTKHTTLTVGASVGVDSRI